MSSTIDYSEFMRGYARLKKIPLLKVIHNAAKDFVQAALPATPIADSSKPKWVRAEKDGKVWYLPIERANKRRLGQLEKGGIKYTRLNIRKGWSRSTWIGVMQALGMTSSRGKPAKPQTHAIDKSDIAFSEGENKASAVITDRMKIDHFGRTTSDARFSVIAAAGFELAAWRMTRDYAKHIKEAWR